MLTEDKRVARRVPIEAPMSYNHTNDGETHQATTLNISSSGLLFACQEALKTGSLLEVNVQPGSSITPPLDATIEVVHSRLAGDSNSNGGDQYHVGSMIKHIK